MDEKNVIFRHILTPFLFIMPILLSALGIYALILLIKALKKYIDKNS